MSIKFVFKADNSDVVAKLGEIKQQMSSMSWADMAVGMHAMVGLLNQAKSAISSLMAPAAALEDMSIKLGVMLNDRAAGSALATSFERLATNGVVSLQDLQGAAASLVGVFSDPRQVEQWVPVLANIAAGSRLSATQIAEMVAGLNDTGKARLTEMAKAGIPVYQTLAKTMGLTVEEVKKLQEAGDLTAAHLLQAFAAMTAEGQKFHDLNATMSNTTSGSWATLVASWQELLAAVGESLNNVIRPAMQKVSTFLQEHKAALTAALKLVVQLGTAWAAVKAVNIAAGVWAAVKALKAAVVEARALSAALALSPAGLVSTAVGGIAFGASYVFNRSQELKAQEEEAEARRKESWAKHNRELEEKEAAARAKAAAEQEKIWGKVNQERLAEAKALMLAAKTVKEFDDALKTAKENGLGSRKDVFVNGGFDTAAARAAAVSRESSAALMLKEGKYYEAAQAAHWARVLSSFSAQDAAGMRTNLSGYFSDLGLGSLPDSQYTMAQTVASARHMAALDGNAARYARLERLQKYVDAYASQLEKEAADAAAQQQAREAAALKRRSALADIATATRRDSLVLSGNESALAAFDDEQERRKLSAQYQAAGLSAQEADFYAAQAVARSRKIKARAAEVGGGQGVQTIASGLASVGGGGAAIRLGDSQLAVSQKQLDALTHIRGLVDKIVTRSTGIPVTV